MLKFDIPPVRARAFALSGLIVKFIQDIGRCPMLLLLPFQGLTKRLKLLTLNS